MGLWVAEFQGWNFAAAPRPKTVQKSDLQQVVIFAAQPQVQAQAGLVQMPL